jgi:transmembrane protein 17
MLRRPPQLPRSVNDRLNRLATSFFTPNEEKDLKRGNNFHSKQARIEIDYSSSLPLQMLLYFNVCFFPCWLFSLAFVLPVLALASSNQHVILMVFAFLFKAIIECVRLYLGYAGNLAERMPELTAFCLLTIIFQAPLSIFLLIYQLIATIEVQLALIFAVEILYLTFLVLEGVFGIYAVRIMVAAQSSRFHYRQFEEILSANDSPSPSG